MESLEGFRSAIDMNLRNIKTLVAVKSESFVHVFEVSYAAFI